MIFLMMIIILSVLMLSAYLFKKGAGTLGLGKINLISMAFYLFLMQQFVGISLIVLGFDEHYMLAKLIDADASLKWTFLAVMTTAVLWPLALCIFLRLFRVSSKEYHGYLKKETVCLNAGYSFWLVCAVSILAIGLLVIFFVKIGYVPLWKLLEQPDGFSFATERIRINQIVVGSVHVRNLLILTAIPVLSYLSFAFLMKTKQKRWFILAMVLFVAAILTKTYNFEKSPIVFHLAIYLFIIIYYKGGMKSRWIFLFAGAGVLLLILAYTLTSGSVQLQLYSGPLSRIIFSPVGVLSYNFDLFPDVFSFLHGRSLSATLLPILGFSPALHLRSARLLMEFYGSESVYAGTAGVMNTLYIGEAYANFGWIGLFLSIVWVAFVMAGLFTLLIKMRKTPATIALAAYLTMNIATTTQGGFFDFIYNINWAFVIVGLLVFEYLPDISKKLKNRKMSKRKQHP